MYRIIRGDIKYNEESDEAFLSLVQNVGILCISVLKYISMLDEFENGVGGSKWIIETEHFYWIQKYHSKCLFMINIVGLKKVKERLSDEQFRALSLVLQVDLNKYK